MRSEKLGELAGEFDAIHSVERAVEVGSVDRIIAAAELRPQLIEAVERGMQQTLDGLAAGNGGRFRRSSPAPFTWVSRNELPDGSWKPASMP